MSLVTYLPADDLIGRTEELRRLGSFVESARTARQALVVTGEAGMGKSSCLRWAMQAAEAHRTTMLHAAGTRLESRIGFATLHQMLVPHDAAIGALEVRHRIALRTCLGLTEGPPPSRTTIAAATVALLRLLASDAPVLLAVDDLHWVDRASSSVLDTVVVNLAGSPVGVLTALRQNHPSLVERPVAPELHLYPLGVEAANRLLDRREEPLTTAARRQLLDEARGNPLALLHLPVSDGPSPGRLRAHRLPDSLTSVFASSIQDLPTSTRTLLLLAALDTSRTLDVVLAAGTGRVSEADVGTAVREGLIRVDGHSRTFEFAHPLLRSTTVELARSPQRREAHQLLGEAESDHSLRRAQHLADARVAPHEPTAALVEDSARMLLGRGDPSAAVRAYLRAAELSERPDVRGRRLAQAAYIAADVTGDLHQVAGWLREIRAGVAVDNGSFDTSVAVAYLLLNGDGDVDTAHRLLVSALESPTLTEDIPETSVVKALETLMAVCFFGGRDALWESFRVQLARLGPRVPVSLRLCAHTFASPAREGAAVLEELRSVLDELDDEPDLGTVALIARAAFYVDELDRCAPALWRAVNQGSDRGAMTPVVNAWMLLAFQAWLNGRWEDASTCAREGLRLCETHGYDLFAWPGRYCLALVAAARGEDDVASSLSGEMLRWAQPRGARTIAAYAHHVLAVAALGRRDFESAYRQASRVSRPGEIDPALPHALWLTMDLVEAAVHCRHEQDASDHVAEMRALDLGALSGRHALIVAGCAAMVASDDSLELFERALAIPEAETWPFELARVQLAYGERLHRARLDVRARDQLVAALEAFELLGAAPWVARARSQLAASSGIPASDAQATGALTLRELEVAALAAAGMTNKQIAAELQTSPRTVSAHLSHVFGKLAVHSRAGLRDALGSPDRPDDSHV